MDKIFGKKKDKEEKPPKQKSHSNKKQPKKIFTPRPGLDNDEEEDHGIDAQDEEDQKK